MKKIIISVDGPAGSGKGRIALYLSKRWGLRHIDSGILYRRLAFQLIKNEIKYENESKIKKYLLNNPSISFRNHKKLRNEYISLITSQIAKYKSVRNYINKIQRDFVLNHPKNRGFNIKSSKYKNNR